MPAGVAESGEGLCLIARARAVSCALPLAYVVEIMRPLAVDRIANAPSFMLGVAVVRGAPVPVIDCGAFVQGGASAAHTRWASVRAGERSAVIAFEEILGVRSLPRDNASLPPLLSSAPSEVLAGLALLDRKLLLVLHGSRLLPDAVWSAFDARSDA
jgi:purine-binding chemotaxis protein CheW